MIKKQLPVITAILLSVVLIVGTQPANAATYDCAYQLYIPEAECEALVALYNATDGTNWTNHIGWLSYKNPCTWHGVNCNTSGDSIQMIDLNDNHLVGNLPSALGNLSNLQDLWLGKNILGGSIPAELGNLSQLQYLILSVNRLSGIIPLGMTNLTQLDAFFFNDTRLCEPDNATFQAWKAGITSYGGTGVCIQDMFYSLANYDGWVRELSETSKSGGLSSSTMLMCYLGDDDLDRQYRTFLHFNTSRLPDDAVVSKATLQYKQHSIVGSDPYVNHGRVAADIKIFYFGTSADLELSDFGEIASLQNAGYFRSVPTSLSYSLYRSTLTTNSLWYINRTGATQFRLRFTIDDDDDMSEDYIKIFCGDMNVPFNRPVLRVWYHIPVS